MPRRRKKKIPTETPEVEIESLSHDGRGIARLEGKTVFIDGALPDEHVRFRYIRCRSKFDEGEVLEVLKASAYRVMPECEFFRRCGGCSLQHLQSAEQIKFKQSTLLENFRHIGKVTPQTVLPPLSGPSWGYRQKARLGVRFVRKKNRVLVGFREKHSAFLAEMHHCRILHPQIGEHLHDLSEMIGQLSCYDKIAQIEVAIGEAAAALIFRNLVALTKDDRKTISEFGKNFGFQIYLQPKGPDTVSLLWPEKAELTYALPGEGIKFTFQPNDFTQVNSEINRKMIRQALALLDLNTEDEVLELFCGLGNFTLPIAKRVKKVTAVEGDAGLIQRARANAGRNRIENVEFHVANLMESVEGVPWLRRQQCNKVFLDPPRSGALEMLPPVAALKPGRIVYVSCNPATLARDAGILVNEYGYRLQKAGVMDMFPHTTHVESIALFVKE